MSERWRWTILLLLAVLVVGGLLRHHTLVARHRVLEAQLVAQEQQLQAMERQIQATSRQATSSEAMVTRLLEQTEALLRMGAAPHRESGRWMAGDCIIPWDVARGEHGPGSVHVVINPTPPVQVEARDACPVPERVP